MSQYNLSDDPKGYPILKRAKGSPSPASEPREIRLGIEHFDLYDESGRVLGPSESLYRLLDNGPITESQFAMLAAHFDDPETIHHAARQLGVRRVKRDDGTIVLRLPEEDEIPKRRLSEQLGITEAGDPIVAASRDYPSPEHLAATSQQHGVNFADSPFDRHADLSSGQYMTFKAAGKLLAQHGISIIGSGLKIHRDLNDPHSRERYVRISEVRELLSKGRRGRGAGELIEEQLQKAQQQRSRDRYSGKRVGAAETTRRVIAREPDPAQERAKERAQRARANNSRKRREATASRRRTISMPDTARPRTILPAGLDLPSPLADTSRYVPLRPLRGATHLIRAGTRAGSRPAGGYELAGTKAQSRPRGGYPVAGKLSTIRAQRKPAS